MGFKIGTFEITAVQVLVRNNNLAERYLRKYAALQLGKTAKVYNLTINGAGRFYYSPEINILAIYLLLEFSVARESFHLLAGLKERLSNLAINVNDSPSIL